MHVVGRVSIRVLNLDEVPCSAFHPRKDDAPVANRLHGRPSGCSVVDAEVRAIFLQDRMKAVRAEVRGNRRGIFERRMKERLLHGVSFRCVISRMAVGVVEEHGAEGATFIDIFRSEDAAVGCNRAVRELLLFDHHPKRVAGARVGVEVEVVGENFGQAQGELGLFARVNDGFEERPVNFTADAGRCRLGRNRLNLRVEIALARLDQENAVRIYAVAHQTQISEDRPADRQSVPGADLTQIENRLRGSNNSRRDCGIESHDFEHLGERHSRRDSLFREDDELRLSAQRFFVRERRLHRYPPLGRAPHVE